MKHRNQTVYRARLHNLKLDAFGRTSTLTYDCIVDIYQARANPELWRSRPMFKSGTHKWEAGTAEELMAIINADFESVLKPWFVLRTAEPVGPQWPYPGRKPEEKNGVVQTDEPR